MKMYSFTKSELEDLADKIKVLVLDGMLESGLVVGKDGTDASYKADEWSMNHTVLVRRKTLFRTVSALWQRTAEHHGLSIIVVRRVWRYNKEGFAQDQG